MKFLSFLQPLFWTAIMGSPLPSLRSTAISKPPFFVLAGDSTTAPNGGWGDAFLNTTVFKGASGKNLGHSGATTASFRAGGDWANVLATVAQVNSTYSPIVTIQFGHNDQKSTSGVSLAQYTTNLEKFAAEVIDAGATPILVTPLSRRNYNTSTNPPQVIQDLSSQRIATLQAAKASDSSTIDLNKASTAYLNAIGKTDAWEYNLTPDDATHLNDEGGIVFGGLVATLKQGKFPSFRQSGFLKVNQTLQSDLSQGIFYWP